MMHSQIEYSMHDQKWTKVNPISEVIYRTPIHEQLAADKGLCMQPTVSMWMRWDFYFSGW